MFILNNNNKNKYIKKNIILYILNGNRYILTYFYSDQTKAFIKGQMIEKCDRISCAIENFYD